MKFDATERMNELFLQFGIGDYSLSKYLYIVSTMVLFMCLLPYTVALLRGAGKNVAIASVKDVSLGIACAIGVITFHGFFFFVGRGFLTAFTART